MYYGPTFSINLIDGKLYLRKHKKLICIYNHYTNLRRHRYLKSFLVKGKYLFILHNQYHGCWCPGDSRSQAISSHGINLSSWNILVLVPKGFCMFIHQSRQVQANFPLWFSSVHNSWQILFQLVRFIPWDILQTSWMMVILPHWTCMWCIANK